MNVADRVKEIIESQVPEAKALVLDPMNDGQHFQAIVTSPAFEGLPLVKQHQLVMNALKQEFEGAVHALQLKTVTAQEWKAMESPGDA